jgi:hypothetical protein
MSLLPAEAVLLVLLLALQRRAALLGGAAALPAASLVGVVDADVEQVTGVVGRARRVCFPLCE